MDKIPIFMMFNNQEEWTNLSLEYLRKNTDSERYRLILINNGSKRDVFERMRSLISDPDSVVDFTDEVGVSYAYNSAIKKHLQDSEHFVIVHNDVLVSDSWLERMIRCADKISEESKIDYLAVFPRTNYCSERTPSNCDNEIKTEFLRFKTSNKKFIFDKSEILEVVERSYATKDSLESYAKRISEEHDGRYAISEELCTFCTLFNTKHFIRLGMFDEDFIRFGGESKFLNHKALKSSLFSIHILDAFVHHNGNTTTDYVGRSYPFDSEESDRLCKSKIRELQTADVLNVKRNTKITKGEASILAIRTDGIGDIITTLCVLNGIKGIGENISITYASKKEYLPFLLNFSCVDKVIPVEEGSGREEGHRKDFSSMYSNKFDYIFDWTRYFEIADGSRKEKHRIEQVIDYIREQSGNVDWLEGICIAAPAYNFDSEAYPLIPDVEIESIVLSPIGDCDIRSIPLDVYQRIAEIESENKRVIILGKDKVPLNMKKIANADNVVDLSGRTRIEEIPPIVRKCSYVYTPDSGIFHLAGVLNVPCRAFFGTIDPDLRDGYYPSSGRNMIYKKNLPCVPCGDVGCSTIECMQYTNEEIERIVSGELL